MKNYLFIRKGYTLKYSKIEMAAIKIWGQKPVFARRN
jgi:hypothetical protein